MTNDEAVRKAREWLLANDLNSLNEPAFSAAEIIRALLAENMPVGLTWDMVIRVVDAERARCQRAGAMFPQVAEETRESNTAFLNVLSSLRFARDQGITSSLAAAPDAPEKPAGWPSEPGTSSAGGRT